MHQADLYVARVQDGMLVRRAQGSGLFRPQVVQYAGQDMDFVQTFVFLGFLFHETLGSGFRTV